MSMLDSFFSKGAFKAAKCKTLLKLTIPRIKLLRNRREIQIKQMRRGIANLLHTAQEATARIRVEHILREERMMAAQEIIELFSELIVVRLPIIEAQRECPLDLKEAISSVCFAAPRCADLPELLQVQMAFAGKYGKEFVAAATELMPECGVNRQLIELLSVHAPAPDVKLKLLKEIAEEHQLDWDPSTSETELLKPHEDLLNGPTQFASGSKLPLPKEQHDDESSLCSASGQAPQDEQSDSDSEFDLLDLPQVPSSVIMTGSVASALRPEMLPFPPSALSDLNQEPETAASDPKEALLEESVVTKEEPEELNTTTVGTNVEEKQFLPFISPPSSLPLKQINPVGELRNKNDVEVKVVDLQDVLAAAQAAAESAERAATAARSAATLAQVRISELVNKNNDHDSVIDKPSNPNGSSENPFSLDRQASSTHGHYHDDVIDSASPQASHLPPQRLPSLDDDPYFSYPNLFTSQQSNVSRADSFADHSHSTTDGI